MIKSMKRDLTHVQINRGYSHLLSKLIATHTKHLFKQICQITQISLKWCLFIHLQLIRWRDFSHKLLLYISDAGFHIAGDGRVGGVY